MESIVCTNISSGPVSFRMIFQDLLILKSVGKAINESIFLARTVIEYRKCILKIVAFSKEIKKRFVIFI